MIERKTFTGELKTDGAGALVATFSRFGVVDHDKDVTLASAIPDGMAIVLGSYNHSSVSGVSLPIGVGYVRNDGSRAQIAADIFDTAAARDEYRTIKGLGALAEFSYSFKVLDASTDYAELKAYPGADRILKSLDVIEACAVIRGAGIGTGIDSAKRSLVAIPEDYMDDMMDRLDEIRERRSMRIDPEFVDTLHRTVDASRFMRYEI